MSITWIPGAPWRWKLHDPATNIYVELPINPVEGGSPTYRKNISYQSTAAPGGTTLMFEGQDEPKQMEVSGEILTREHYEMLTLWFNKRNQIQLTDDLGRVMWIYITEFSPKRVRSTVYPWRHSYTLKYTALDVP